MIWILILKIGDRKIKVSTVIFSLAIVETLLWSGVQAFSDDPSIASTLRRDISNTSLAHQDPPRPVSDDKSLSDAFSVKNVEVITKNDLRLTHVSTHNDGVSNRNAISLSPISSVTVLESSSSSVSSSDSSSSEESGESSTDSSRFENSTIIFLSRLTAMRTPGIHHSSSGSHYQQNVSDNFKQHGIFYSNVHIVLSIAIIIPCFLVGCFVSMIVLNAYYGRELSNDSPNVVESVSCNHELQNYLTQGSALCFCTAADDGMV